MTPKIPVGFTSRTSFPVVKREKIPLYFLACEGLTEISYFNSLRNYLFEQGVYVQFRYLNRTYSERDMTNPRDLLNLIFAEKDSADFEEITIEKIVRIVDDWMRKEHIIPDSKLRNVFESAADNIIGRMEHRKYYARDIIRFADIEEGKENRFFETLDVCIKAELAHSIITEYSMDDFKNYLKQKLQELGFEEGDKICLICDRDFYEEEIYDDAVNQCKKNGIGFYVTNPCFEFWILLHFDDVLQIPPKKLLQNEMVISESSNVVERFTLLEVKRHLPTYRKEKVPFSKLKMNIQDAIEREKQFFSEDELRLKTELGSRIGILVSELINLPKPKENQDNLPSLLIS